MRGAMVVVEAGASFPDPGEDGPVLIVRPEAMEPGEGHGGITLAARVEDTALLGSCVRRSAVLDGGDRVERLRRRSEGARGQRARRCASGDVVAGRASHLRG